MASTDARPVPIKNTAYRLTFPIYKNDGTLITGATGLDSEVSKDAGTAADCTNEATEIATSTGMYYLDLTSTEMNADCVAVVVKTTSTGACIPTFVLYPNEAGDIDVDVTAWLGTAAATPTTAGVPEVDITYIAGAAVSTTTAQLGVNVVQISADATAADNLELAFDGTGYAGGATPQQVVLTTSGKEAVADQVWDEASSGHIAAGSFGALLPTIRANTAQAGAATTITLDASASAVDGFYTNQRIHIVAGTGAGQGRIISDYNGTTKVATVATWAVNPANDSVFVITPFGSIPGASAPTAAEVADAVLDEAISDHTAEGSVGAVLGTIHLHAGTAQAGAASSITLDATGSSTTVDFYKYDVVVIRAGTGAGQSRQISAYSAARVATVSPAWTTTPDNTSEYVIVPLGIDASTPANVATAVWAAARASNATAGSFGEYVNADVLRLSGDATAADNAEAFFDGTGYAGTGNVIPTVTAVTNQVTANVTALSGDSVAADNAEAFFDGTGYAGTGNVIPSVTTVTGNIAGSVASVTGNVGGNVTGSVGSLAAQAKADVNAEVVDALNTDTYAEPGQEAPGATVSLVKKIGYLYKAWRNKVDQTSTQYSLYADDATTVDQKSTVADDGTTATRGEVGSGP